MCQLDSAKQFTWVYADPWLRLPVGMAGISCTVVGSHARSAFGDGAVLCSGSASGKTVWTPDPEWAP